jgi:hypothetical protein
MMYEKDVVQAETTGSKSDTAAQPHDTPEAKDEKTDLSKAHISNYWRIISYGSRPDHMFMLVAFAASAGSGVAMPLMNIVLGNLVGDFNNFFLPNTSTAESDFKRSVDRYGLIIFGLFLGKLVLTYISMVFNT